MLFESNRNASWLRCRLEQFGMCVQCTRRNMVSDPSFREGCHIGPEFSGCIHQLGQRTQRSTYFRPVSALLFHFPFIHASDIIFEKVHRASFISFQTIRVFSLFFFCMAKPTENWKVLHSDVNAYPDYSPLGQTRWRREIFQKSFSSAIICTKYK